MRIRITRWAWCAGALSMLALLWVGIAPKASAESIYEYTGDLFTSGSTSDRVTATIVLMQPLATSMTFGEVFPQSFSMSAGPLTITDASSDLVSERFFFATDGSGTITTWTIDASVVTGVGAFCDIGVENCIGLFSNGSQDIALEIINGEVTYDGLTNSAGTWELVPEPSTLWLSALGLLGLAAARRRRAVA